MSLHCLIVDHPRMESSAHFNDVANAPLSACLLSGSLAAVLREQDIEAQLYDANLDGHSLRQCTARLREAGCDVLAVHAVYFWEHTPRLFEMLTDVRRAQPEVLIVLFGFFPTFSRQRIHALCPAVDVIIIGEPEIGIAELVRAYAAGGRDNLADTAGLSICRNGRIVETTPRECITDLDRMPFALRSAQSLNSLGGLVLGSRGCVNRCSFCCIPGFYGAASGWRGRSPENITAEIDTLLNRINTPSIYFLDANFFAPGPAGRTRALTLAELLAERSLTFGLECRTGDVDPAVFTALAHAGLRDVFLGVESASAESLRRMRKNVNLWDNTNAIAVLRSLGIEPTPGFIMFDADTCLEDVRENFYFLRSHNLLQRLQTSADVLYHREILLRGMPRLEQFTAQGRVRFRDSLAHEGHYCFRDPDVQVLADSMSVACRHVLRMRATQSSPIYWQHGEHALTQNISACLADLFDEMLGRLEKGERSTGHYALAQPLYAAISRIESMVQV